MSALGILNLTVQFNSYTCARAGCGAVVAIPSDAEARLRKSHETFYCYHGHPQSFTGESEESKLKRQLEMVEQRAQTERKRVEAEQERTRRANLSANAFKGQVTRMRNRVKNGVCPCCNRTFQNLMRHMNTQHPDYASKAPEETDES